MVLRTACNDLNNFWRVRYDKAPLAEPGKALAEGKGVHLLGRGSCVGCRLLHRQLKVSCALKVVLRTFGRLGRSFEGRFASFKAGIAGVLVLRSHHQMKRHLSFKEKMSSRITLALNQWRWRG